MIDLSDPISRQQAITTLRALSDDDGYINVPHEVVTDVVRGLPPVQAKQGQTVHSEQTKKDKLGAKTGETCEDCISRQAAIDAIKNTYSLSYIEDGFNRQDAISILEQLPSAQPERKWIPCSNPPKHHKDVIVRGIEAIGNVTVHKVMQWDVDTWRPTDYAPSVTWKEWSEI